MLGEERAVSEVIGYILAFTLVIATVTFISFSVVDTLQERSDRQSVNNAELAMDVLADNVEDVWSGTAPSRATEISLGQGSITLGENVYITVEVVEGGGASSSTTWAVRPLIYTGETGTRIVYVAGAIFRIQDQGAFRLRNPPFLLAHASSDRDRIVLPIVQTTGDSVRKLSGSTVLIRTGTESVNVPEMWTYDSKTTPADPSETDYETVKIRVDSPRANQWKAYFSTTTMSSCSSAPAPSPSPPASYDTTCYQFEGQGTSSLIDHLAVVRHEMPVTLEG